MQEVHLYVYDLSNGLAAQLSVQLTGRFFKAIYHTSIVIFDREYFFGGSGIESSAPAQSPHGTPIERKLIGTTEVTQDIWQQFLNDCAEDYGVGKYHLLEHNCNTFSDAALQFLLGQHIPPEISSLPSDFLSTPLGMMMRTQIDAMYAPRPGAQSAVRKEVTINGPTSGDHKDRSADAYKFDNTPTISKVFAKLKSQKADDSLSAVEAATESLAAGRATDEKQLASINDYLKLYFAEVPTPDSFPGLDLVRLWLRNVDFVKYQTANPALLAAIFDRKYDEAEAANSLGVLLKLISNGLNNTSLRDTIISLLRQYEQLETVSSSVLSTNTTVVETGLKTIWNIMILCDGIDNDFKVACLASVAESRNGSEKAEVEQLKSKILKEILQGGGDEIMDMADILELS